MKLEIFTVYDSKAQAYLPPFFLPSVAVATRVFSNASNDPGHAFGANPGDYTLFHIGDFDDDSAKIKTKATPRNIGVAQEFKKVEINEKQAEMFYHSGGFPSEFPGAEKLNAELEKEDNQ